MSHKTNIMDALGAHHESLVESIKHYLGPEELQTACAVSDYMKRVSSKEEWPAPGRRASDAFRYGWGRRVYQMMRPSDNDKLFLSAFGGVIVGLPFFALRKLLFRSYPIMEMTRSAYKAVIAWIKATPRSAVNMGDTVRFLEVIDAWMLFHGIKMLYGGMGVYFSVWMKPDNRYSGISFDQWSNANWKESFSSLDARVDWDVVESYALLPKALVKKGKFLHQKRLELLQNRDLAPLYRARVELTWNMEFEYVRWRLMQGDADPLRPAEQRKYAKFRMNNIRAKKWSDLYQLLKKEYPCKAWGKECSDLVNRTISPVSYNVARRQFDFWSSRWSAVVFTQTVFSISVAGLYLWTMYRIMRLCGRLWWLTKQWPPGSGTVLTFGAMGVGFCLWNRAFSFGLDMALRRLPVDTSRFIRWLRTHNPDAQYPHLDAKNWENLCCKNSINWSKVNRYGLIPRALIEQSVVWHHQLVQLARQPDETEFDRKFLSIRKKYDSLCDAFSKAY